MNLINFLFIIGFKEADVIIFGRSIGSAPSIYIAANRNPAALIVLSGFKSIRFDYFEFELINLGLW